MLSLRLRLLLLGVFAIAAVLVGAIPLLLSVRGWLSASSALYSCQQPESADTFHGDLRLFPSSWNHLSFPSSSSSSEPHVPPPVRLRIAVFVKKWPFGSSAGGLERHALTLHGRLAERGHHVHIFTTDGATAGEPRESQESGLHFHIFPPNENGRFNIAPAWETFMKLNGSTPFDIVHSESVALPPANAKEVGAIGVVSWHGIAYEIIHSDIVRELQGGGNEPKAAQQRMARVVEEVRVFPSYAHHVATSDYAGDVLYTIYQIPLTRLHIIVNGADERRFAPANAEAAQRFRTAWGVPPSSPLVLGAAGRLVKDKGYPLLFQAFSLLLVEHPSVFLLIAGDGPWAHRFRTLAPTNVMVVGALPPAQLALFYNAIDVFVDPTLRAQGLDHTLLEAMLCAKPILATHFSSITRSIVVHPTLGYTFHPNVPSLLSSMRTLLSHGRQALHAMGQASHQRASLLFTASKMAAAYERLFLCIKESRFCIYD